MPRAERRKSKSGIYHVILRGINRQQIFVDEEDNLRFIETLYRYKAQCGYSIYAYCLMGNHLHILIKEEKEDLALVFKRIAGSYVYWYNRKYNRIGHLFQDRFKSEAVEDESYFFAVLRYIHQNPVKAGICEEAAQYRYSSMNEYLCKNGITDTDFVYSLISKEQFVELHQVVSEEKCMEFEDSVRVTDEEAKNIIEKVLVTRDPTALQRLDMMTRNKCIKELASYGLSIRQISRLTGVSKKIIEKNI